MLVDSYWSDLNQLNTHIPITDVLLKVVLNMLHTIVDVVVQYVESPLIVMLYCVENNY